MSRLFAFENDQSKKGLQPIESKAPLTDFDPILSHLNPCPTVAAPEVVLGSFFPVQGVSHRLPFCSVKTETLPLPRGRGDKALDAPVVARDGVRLREILLTENGSPNQLLHFQTKRVPTPPVVLVAVKLVFCKWGDTASCGIAAR